MTTSVVDARNTHVKETLDDDNSTEDGVAGLLPDTSDPAAAARAETQRAQAEQDYLEAKAAAELQRAIDIDAAAGDPPVVDAAEAAYNAAVAAAGLAYQQAVVAADGDQAIADARLNQAYVDKLLREGDDFETLEDAVAAAEAAYDEAKTAARETLATNLAAHDAALASDLADTFADALEQLALDHPSPWATRAAADARAKSNQISAEQLAHQTYEQTLAEAQADFQNTLTTADLARSESKTAAHHTLLTTASTATLTKATAQSAANQAAAENGASDEKPPEHSILNNYRLKPVGLTEIVNSGLKSSAHD